MALPRRNSYPKIERLETRLTTEQKERIQRAAKLRNLSVSDFVVQSSLEAAEQVIQTEQILSLSAQDSELFVQALLTPREPNAKLKAAFQSHDQDVISLD